MKVTAVKSQLLPSLYVLLLCEWRMLVPSTGIWVQAEASQRLTTCCLSLSAFLAGAQPPWPLVQRCPRLVGPMCGQAVGLHAEMLSSQPLFII